MNLPKNVSESVKRRNPGLFGAYVAPVSSEIKQRDSSPPLEPKLRRRRRGACRPVVVVTVIACRKTLIDEDNNAAGYKAVQDQLCKELGVDDRERHLVKFEYGQVWSEIEGTLIKIEPYGTQVT